MFKLKHHEKLLQISSLISMVWSLLVHETKMIPTRIGTGQSASTLTSCVKYHSVVNCNFYMFYMKVDTLMSQPKTLKTKKWFLSLQLLHFWEQVKAYPMFN